MERHDIRIIVGCPGSGKTHLLGDLRRSGLIDMPFEDGLEDGKRSNVIDLARRQQAEGRRVGICGQYGITIAHRRLILDSFAGEVHFSFMAADYAACLRNVIRDTLNGRDHGWERACRIDAIWRRGEYEMPAGIKPRPVHKCVVSASEVEDFFVRANKPFGADTKDRIHHILAES